MVFRGTHYQHIAYPISESYRHRQTIVVVTGVVIDLCQAEDISQNRLQFRGFSRTAQHSHKQRIWRFWSNVRVQSRDKPAGSTDTRFDYLASVHYRASRDSHRLCKACYPRWLSESEPPLTLSYAERPV